MRDDIRKEVLERITRDYKFEGRGEWLRKGKCPDCGQREMFTRADAPWVLRCGREERCGKEHPVKALYPDIFDSWSNRFKATEADPTAAADAYLSHSRYLDLRGLRGCYTQENFYDRERKIGSATVRFELPGGSWWERLIDQPGRFEKKANFKYGASHRGHWWSAPDQGMDVLAQAKRIWIVEGIFDALSLRQVGECAVTPMSCNLYPEISLGELRKAIAEVGGTAGPELIFAFDVGKAGVEYTRKFVKRARSEGWRATAAQVKAEGEGEKADWNDLLGADKLTPADLEEYLWHGEVLIAPNATEKACLIYDRRKWRNFHLIHDSRTWWANFNKERIAEVMTAEGVTERAAARACVNVDEIANCAFRVLYFQRDDATDESHYYLRVDAPFQRVPHKAAFPPAALAGSGDFKKRLYAVSPGGQWLGTTHQLDKLIASQTTHIKTVQTLDFTGYSREHGAWVLGDIAVKDGRVVKVNDEDYFDLGKLSLKLRTSERMLSINYDAEVFETRWLRDVWVAYQHNGLITVAFWILSLFAEQVRKMQKSLAFLEAYGDPGTGKSTLLEFLWKASGRENYEGFDPQKSTPAAIARMLGKVANLPVVLIEGDRDEKASHAKKFEWEELKTAYNGRSVRSRGVRSGGNETYEPPFRGAVIIAQNNPVDASPAVMERIIQVEFGKAHWSSATKEAADRLGQWPAEELSGFIVHVIRREAEFLKAYRAAFDVHERELNRRGEVRNIRLVLNYAQLAAALDAFASITEIDPNARKETIARIYRLAAERRASLSKDHPIVAKFWELFDWIEANETDQTAPEHRINQHRKRDTIIAVVLPQFEEKCRARGITSHPSHDELKKYLRSSKSRKFVDMKSVNTVSGRQVYCWVFERPNSPTGNRKGD